MLWRQTPLLPMWAALLYHLLTVHALYYAPIYGWLLLVSGWARRAAFLWASLPVAAILIIEKLVFNTSAFARMLLSRLGGGPAPFPFRRLGTCPCRRRPSPTWELSWRVRVFGPAWPYALCFSWQQSASADIRDRSDAEPESRYNQVSGRQLRRRLCRCVRRRNFGRELV